MDRTLDDAPLYNSRIIRIYLDYLLLKLPQLNLHDILHAAGMTIHQVDDRGHWFTQRQVDVFYQVAWEKTGIPDLARQAGRFAAFSKAAGDVHRYALGFLTPAAAFTMMGKIYATASHACDLKTRQISKQAVEITVQPKGGIREKPYQCENRMGIFEALGKIYTNRYPKIEHPECYHRGGEACRYRISWEPMKSFFWGRLRMYVASLLLMFFAGAAFFASIGAWTILFLAGALAVLALSLLQTREQKKELMRLLQKEGESADRLLEQINLRYNNVQLMREVGQVTSRLLDVEALLRGVMETMERRLDFDRGLIMLANEKRDRLVYRRGYGYRQEQEGILHNTFFHLDKPDSKGPFVLCYRNQEPILIEDVEALEETVSARSFSLAKTLGVQSFLCVPIIYEGESEGILAVDNLRSRRQLSQSDISLLMGIAPQIAVGLNNARSYHLIQEREERFRALSENSPDIIYTLGLQGEITYLNPAWERILGYPVADMPGASFVDFVKPSDRENIRAAFRKIRDQKSRVNDLLGTLIHRDGTERVFAMSGAPNLDSGQRVTGVVGTFKDITDLKRSETELQRTLVKLRTAMNSTIDAITIIVESRDPYTAGHQTRVANLACAIAEEMRLSPERVDAIRMGCLLHDIGKIYIPSEILSRPGKLSQIERELIHSHPEVGYHILKKVDFVPLVAEMVYQHHERMNGSGYPRGLQGEQILLEARIMAVADVVEAMASHRPYRPSLGVAQALAEIGKGDGVYDDRVVDACLRLFQDKGYAF